MKNIFKKIVLVFFVTSLIASCEVKEFSDLNSPDLNDLLKDPSLGDIQDLLGGMRLVCVLV